MRKVLLVVPVILLVSAVLGFVVWRVVAPGSSAAYVSASVGNHYMAHLWLEPHSEDGTCYDVTSSRIGLPAHPTDGPSGRVCGKGRVPPGFGSPLGFNINIGLREGDPTSRVPPIMDGVAYATTITRIEIEWRGGAYQLQLRNGYFLGGGLFLYLPPFKNLPYFVVAYDDAGRVVDRERIPNSSLYSISRERLAALRRFIHAHPVR